MTGLGSMIVDPCERLTLMQGDGARFLHQFEASKLNYRKIDIQELKREKNVAAEVNLKLQE